MRSVFNMGHSHFDTGGPSTEHNENFSERCKGEAQLEFGQFFSDLHDLNRLWTVRDIGGQTAAPHPVLEIFSFGPILRPTCEDMRRQWRISALALPDFARIEIHSQQKHHSHRNFTSPAYHMLNSKYCEYPKVSKSPFDLFKAIGEAAKFVDDVSKAAAEHRKKSGNAGDPWRVQDIAAGIFDTVTKDSGSRGQKQKSQGRTSSDRSARGARAGSSHAPSGRKTRTAPGYSAVSWAINDARQKATRKYDQQKRAISDEIAGQFRRLKNDRVLLLREPDSMPILDPENAKAFFIGVSRKKAELSNQLEKIFSELQREYRTIAERMAAEQSPPPIEEWQQKVEEERLADLNRAQIHLARIDAALSQLAGELEEFRAELASTSFEETKIDFDPGLPVIRQFRKGMQLGAPDLAQIRVMLDSEWTEECRAYAKLPFREVLDTERRWKSEGMSVDAVDFVVALYGRMTLFSALREMGLGKSEALKPGPATEVPKGADRPSGGELLKRIPGHLPFNTNEQRDRLIDTLVLASECALPPIETYNLIEASENVMPVPVGDGDDERRRHYCELVQRLENSALATIGKKTGDRSKQSFRPWHLSMLRQLREAANIHTPSQALSAWEQHLAKREIVREELVAKASEFWRPLLTALIDRKGVSESDQFEADRNALKPITAMDAAQRETILAEAKAILKDYDATGFGMASKADGWQSTTAPFGNAQRSLSGKLVQVLEMGEAERAEYFAPAPETPELGKFANLIANLGNDRNYLNNGPFGKALRVLDFDAADNEVRRWLSEAPRSDLRDAILQFDPANLHIDDWNMLEAFLGKTGCAAIGLDLSEHVLCEIRTPDQTAPFEIGWYSRDVFPEGDFGAELVRAHAHYPFPWQGAFEDVGIGLPVKGLAPLVLQLAAFRNEKRGDWSKELIAYHRAVVALVEAFIFLLINWLVAKGLAERSFAHGMPIIIGTHDFGNFDPIVHEIT